MPSAVAAQARFRTYAWAVVAYNILVILWGALVRATGSGAGCGAHWPLCNGQVLPGLDQARTQIEFTHRAMSGLALLAVAGLLWGAWRMFGRGHRARQGAIWAGVFILSEALLGAGLVLFHLVEKDDSAARVIVLAIHLTNTLLLLAALTVTAWAAGDPHPRPMRFDRRTLWMLGGALAGAMVVGASGAITALGDTLFPAGSLAEGLKQDVSGTAHFLVRLRVLHPVLGVLLAIYLGGLALWGRKTPALAGPAALLVVISLAQLGAGALNIYLLAPVWMQMFHLLLADVAWVVLIVFSARAAEGL